MTKRTSRVAESLEGRRKGYVRRAAIPADVLARLNRGEEETVTLVEWLAVDLSTLAGATLGEVGLTKAQVETVVRGLRSLERAGVMQRMRAAGGLVHRTLGEMKRSEARRAQERLSTHRCDILRQWGAYVVAHEEELDLEERLERMRAFAADAHMGVRETAWESMRSYLAADLKRAIALLRTWVEDEDGNIRRCAIEATRPRGVWTLHMNELKQDPGLALPLLDPMMAEEVRYPARAVGNWLNDASKTRAEWVRDLAVRWIRETKNEQATGWILNHGMRTMRRGKALHGVVGRRTSEKQTRRT